ncbi:MAG: hypothetical protein KDA89_21395 [Planctomycetaceae bacterium]|nr:hypothetical protein [Planctomycetaceae bacterium]
MLFVIEVRGEGNCGEATVRGEEAWAFSLDAVHGGGEPVPAAAPRNPAIFWARKIARIANTIGKTEPRKPQKPYDNAREAISPISEGLGENCDA